MSPTAVALLPNAGRANKLFVWAAAEVFADLNGCTAQTIGWSYPKIGPWLRGDRSMRMYARFFYRSSLGALLALGGRFVGRHVHVEPRCVRLARLDSRGTYVFKNVPDWRDMFGAVREHRTFVQARFAALLRPAYRKQLFAHPAPVVALHVRRRDFRPLKSNEDFARVGGVQTPNNYFLSIIAGIRGAVGHDVPVTVFSDGSDAELAFLLSLPNVTRSHTQNDVVDLLLMSRARVIVPSAGSTFSEWAGFLSEAVIVRHPDHIHAAIRPPSLPGSAFECAAPATSEQWTKWWIRASALVAADAPTQHFLATEVPPPTRTARVSESAA